MTNTLGSGRFGQVHLAKFLHGRGEKKYFAVKTINKSEMKGESELANLKLEVEIMK
jgi:serine/threonine protein kinase